MKNYLRHHRDWVLTLDDPIEAIEVACMSISGELAKAAFILDMTCSSDCLREIEACRVVRINNP